MIFGPVEKLILQNPADVENAKELQIIKKSSNSLLQLVNELMDFRKAETGNLRLHVAEDNIVSVLNEIYNSFYDTSLSRNITTEFITPVENIQLYFDRVQLEKVFFNLIHNAFKFTYDGGRISIVVEENKDIVTITIADNGKGIAPENLENLFKNYFQENDYGKQNTGYGIGLALAKSIIELHKGSITVKSETSPDGNSTCFQVILKKGSDHFGNAVLIKSPVISDALGLYEEKAGSDLTAISSATDDDFTSPNDKDKLILVVEDNADIRSFINNSLREHYKVIQSTNGLEGWQSATECIPDIIISDVMMPEMDGFTLCNKLKTDERTSHIPVILLTAKAMSANHINGLKMGADVYLTKPFSVEVLMLQVSNLLKLSEKIRESISHKLKSGEGIPLSSLSPLHNNNEVEKLLNKIDNEFLSRVISIIEEHIDSLEFGVPHLAKAVAMSQPVLYKKLHMLTGMPVNDFIKSIKMNNAVLLLQSKRYNINEIAYMVGFSDRKYFSKEFKKRFGKTPSEFLS